MATFTKKDSINSGGWNYGIFIADGQLGRQNSITLNASTAGLTAAYSPAKGDVLVIREDDSNKHSKFNHDFYSRSASTTLASASVQLPNVGAIDMSTFVATRTGGSALTIGTDFRVDNGVPAIFYRLTGAGTGLPLTGNFIYKFIEEDRDQRILGIVKEIFTSNSAVAVDYVSDISVRYSGIGTAGTATTESKERLLERLRELGIKTDQE